MGDMQISAPLSDRRRFLRLSAGFAGGALLAGCGGGTSGSGVVAVVPQPSPPVAEVAPVAPGQSTHPLNLALNLAYLGAQYYGVSARGTGLPAGLTGGVGRPGAVIGARQTAFADAAIAAYAAELADDKQAHVVALRGEIGALAAAQPPIDLSSGATGAFSTVAQRGGIVAAGTAFDPYASDEYFLLGAFVIENAVAAAYRSLLSHVETAASAPILSANLADAIYHGGLIRSLLDDRAESNAAIDAALTTTSALLAQLDGSNVGDQSLAGAIGSSSNIFDAEGRPIPFTRATTQILQSLYLSNSGIGGFLPAGANGVAV